MSTTLLRDFHRTDRELPTGVPPHRPPPAEHGAEHVRPELSYEETPTYVHPAVVATAVAGYVWMLFVFWIVFAGYGYMGVSLVIATMISAVMLGLLIGCGGSARDVTPWQRPWRSFQGIPLGRGRGLGWAYVRTGGIHPACRNVLVPRGLGDRVRHHRCAFAPLTLAGMRNQHASSE